MPVLQRRRAEEHGEQVPGRLLVRRSVAHAADEEASGVYRTLFGPDEGQELPLPERRQRQSPRTHWPVSTGAGAALRHGMAG